jgi:hypothetical protein
MEKCGKGGGEHEQTTCSVTIRKKLVENYMEAKREVKFFDRQRESGDLRRLQHLEKTCLANKGRAACIKRGSARELLAHQ